MKDPIRKAVIVLFWLILWQTAAMLTDNTILLTGPVEVLCHLAELAGKADFYGICLFSVGRILTGFAAALVLGILSGALSYRFSCIRELLSFPLAVIKSIPVASFVVLLLIWQGAANLSAWISFLVVFPNVCIAARSGFANVDERLREMADIFDIRGVRRFLYLYRPAVLPFLKGSLEACIGMAFKSGAAAEVIGIPDHSIGERLYMSKVYLDTTGLLAWTTALIVLSVLAEKCVLWLFGLLERPLPAKTGQTHGAAAAGNAGGKALSIRISRLCKRFGEKEVLSGITKTLEPGEIYLLMAPSGSGKTTLLRILAGLAQADAGSIETVADDDGKAADGDGKASDRTAEKEDGESVPPAVVYQFQEDRLFENEFTINNIMSTAKRGGKSQCAKALAEILPKDCFGKRAGTLSGGMKRRLSLARAMLYKEDDPAALCLLDEPFAGLDEENKKLCAAFIRRHQGGRTVVVAGHDEKDAALLGGSIWNMETQESR